MATRGRPPSAKTLVDRQLGRNIKHAIMPAGNDYIIPNHSGDHSAGHTGTPVSNKDLVNKEYVDTELSSHTTDTNNPHSTSMTNLRETEIISAEQGEMLAYDDNSNWVNISKGTSGQLLYFNGITGMPEFDDFHDHVNYDMTGIWTFSSSVDILTGGRLDVNSGADFFSYDGMAVNLPVAATHTDGFYVDFAGSKYGVKFWHASPGVGYITVGKDGTMYAAFGVLGSSIGDLIMSDGTRTMFWDASTDILTLKDIRLTGDLTLPKTSGNGIKVDPASPTFGWRDIIGNITNAGGANKPTNTTYRGGITQFKFGAGDESLLEFHMPHDYVPGTNIYIHVHWSHDATTVTGGTLTFTAESIYSKGHNQAAFSAPVTGTFTGTASTTQYQHIISETQYSDSTPTGLMLDTDDLEPDGLIIVRLEMTTNNITVSGGGVPDPFIHTIDVHYQSSNIGTKDKAPNFYT